MSLNQTASVERIALGAGIPDYSASLGDYFALLKPRVMSLVVLTALAGLLVAPVHVHPIVGFASILAIALGAGASGALNMWWDADIDMLMARTRLRPIPAGRILPNEALFFGLTLSLILAYGFHRVIERPLIALGKRQAGRVRVRRAPVPALAPS